MFTIIVRGDAVVAVVVVLYDMLSHDRTSFVRRQTLKRPGNKQ